jgi:uncharacterized protein YlaI
MLVQCSCCKETLDESSFSTRRVKGETVHCKACKNCNEKNKQKMANYRKTDEFQDHMARRRESGVEQAKWKRGNSIRKSKPDQKLRGLLQRRLLRLMNGSRSESKVVFKKTAFASAGAIQAHFRSMLQEGMTLENHGVVWEMEHTIACHWYDHNDDEDVLRCWSPSNMSCMLRHDNYSKGIDIPDDATIELVGRQNWPKAWNGIIPDKEALRAAFHEDRIQKSMQAREAKHTVTP